MAFQKNSLARGDEHRGVRTLQRHLIREDGNALPEHGVDGIFGAETEEAVQTFQLKYDISNPDGNFFGIVGPSTQSKFVEVNVFRDGDRGTGVEMLQEALMKFTIDLPQFGADGDYGSETEAGVREFQSHNNLIIDGIAGSGTITALDRALNTIIVQSGDSGSVVRMVQAQLLEAGESLPVFGVDGAYGEETKEAVKSFQEKNNFSVDGIAGPKTMNLLDSEAVHPMGLQSLIDFAEYEADSPVNLTNAELENYGDILEGNNVFQNTMPINSTSIGKYDGFISTGNYNFGEEAIILVGAYNDGVNSFITYINKANDELLTHFVFEMNGTKYSDDVKFTAYNVDEEVVEEKEQTWLDFSDADLTNSLNLTERVNQFEISSFSTNSSTRDELVEDIQCLLKQEATCMFIGAGAAAIPPAVLTIYGACSLTGAIYTELHGCGLPE